LKKVIVIFLLAALAYGIRYAWTSFPIITGYSAKMACSCMYLSDRSLKSVEEQELGAFPLRLAAVTHQENDSSVTASILGLARQKAIFRKGLGCTLVNQLSEAMIRQQPVLTAIPPLIDQDTINWPKGDRLSDSLPPSIDRKKLQKAIQYAFIEKDTLHLWRSRAVVVVYDGQLVGEQYAAGFDRKTRQLSWSMAKSITSALSGILVKEGKLQLQSPLPVPEWQLLHDGREKITLEQILHQASGLDFEENYARASNATNMLFRQADMGGYTASLKLKDPPGTVFYYTSGNTNLLSRVIRHTVGEKDYQSFPAQALFHKLGMFSAIMEPDASGTFVGSSYVFANARDWARFGLLYANDGVWQNERILPEGWVKQTATPVSVAPQGEYGYQFWLNAGAAGNPSNRRFPDLPADLFYADGYEGQFVFIIPSKNLVVVRLGQTAGDNFNVSGFLSGIISAVP
jgi:hypothetical protein